MNNNDKLAMGVSLGVLLFALVIVVACYVFYCYCLKQICEKTGRNPGVLIWIPIVNLIPVLQVAGMAEWMVILLLVPFVNIVVGVMMWAKVCTARGKSPWLVVMVFIPLLNLAFLPYLAFSE